MISQKQLFLQLLGQTSPNPLLLEVERAQGVYMYTPQGKQIIDVISGVSAVSYTHLRAHETPEHLVCRLLLEKKKKHTQK